MSEEKFTPGPWTHFAAAGGWDCVKPQNHNTSICNLVENNPYNADLIAAAPEMYGALRGTLDILDGFLDDNDFELTAYYKTIISILKKARGEK